MNVVYQLVYLVDLKTVNPIVWNPSNWTYLIDRRRTFVVAGVAVADGIVAVADFCGNRRILTNYLRTFGLDLNYLKNVSYFAVDFVAISDDSIAAVAID